AGIGQARGRLVVARLDQMLEFELLRVRRRQVAGVLVHELRHAEVRRGDAGRAPQVPERVLQQRREPQDLDLGLDAAGAQHVDPGRRQAARPDLLVHGGQIGLQVAREARVHDHEDVLDVRVQRRGDDVGRAHGRGQGASLLRGGQPQEMGVRGGGDAVAGDEQGQGEAPQFADVLPAQEVLDVVPVPQSRRFDLTERGERSRRPPPRAHRVQLPVDALGELPGVVLVVVVADGDGQENPLSRLLVTCVRETVPNVTPRVQHVTSVTVMNHSGGGTLPTSLPHTEPGLVPAVTHDAVVIVPGIMGSELYDTVAGRTIWGLANGSWLGRAWLTRDGLAPLRLTDEERAGDHSRVRARRLLRTPAWSPFLRGVEPYHALVRTVENT